MTLNGKVIGTWKRTLEKKSVIIHPDFFVSLKKIEREAFTLAAERYGKFLGLSVEVKYK